MAFAVRHRTGAKERSKIMYLKKNSNSGIGIGKDLFVWGFVLAAMAALAFGDVGQSAAAARANEGVGSVSGGEVISVGGTIQTLSFKKDATIKEALGFLAKKYHKNIVPSPNVDGILSFTSLFDVTFEEAMDAILGVNFKYKQVGQLIEVYTRAEYQKIKEDKDRMVYKVFTLYYITSEEAKKLITPVLSGDGRVEFSSAAENTISGGGGGGDSMALHDAVVVYDFPEHVAKAEEVIKSLDIRPKQVLLEATILSATLDEDTDFGIDWNLLKGVGLTGSLTQISGGLSGTMMETPGFATTTAGGLRVGIRSSNVVGFIRALEKITDVTVLANPKILAVNKQEGSVLIGSKLGYKSQTTQTDGGTTTEKVEFLETGTRLVFRPYIGNDGYIRMDIYPKDSSATLNTTTQIPDETTTELRTNILVKDGETIVIGGLFRDVVNVSRTQVPLLGDIPFIGALFSGQTDQTQRQEVIIMLTPHIIDAAGESDGEDRAADIGRKRFGARMELLGISRAKLADDHYAKAVQYYADGNSVEALQEVDNALRLRPSYLEALRMKERIIGEVSPDEVARMERIMLGVIEQEEAPKWRKR